jgi:exosome complex RNA-binding protein Rrp42 (RNase PH superfamily)
VLPDLSAYEEPLAETIIEIIVDQNGTLAGVSQFGIVSTAQQASQQILEECTRAAMKRRTELRNIVDSF